MRKLMILILLFIFNLLSAQEKTNESNALYYLNKSIEANHVKNDMFGFEKNLIIGSNEFTIYNTVHEVSSGMNSDFLLLTNLFTLEEKGWIILEKREQYIETFIKPQIEVLINNMSSSIKLLDTVSMNAKYPGLIRAIKDLTNICVVVRDKYRNMR